jgi:hypothetical protein
MAHPGFPVLKEVRKTKLNTNSIAAPTKFKGKKEKLTSQF